MNRNTSGVHKANAAKRAAASPPQKAPPKRRRRKPGPKPGPRAQRDRQKRREEIAAKDAFLPKFDRFVALLAEGQTHRAAMDETRLAWPEISRFMGNDLGLRARYDAAKTLRDELWKEEHFDEMHRRAVVGVPERVVSAGKEFGTQQVYSDSLLLALNKADHPDKFAERTKGELSVNVPETLAGLVAEIEKETPIGATAPVTAPPGGLPMPQKTPSAPESKG